MTAPLAFLLEVYGPDGRTSDWALAVLDPDTLSVIARRRTAYERSRAEDRQYHEAYYFDSRAVDFLANGNEDVEDAGGLDPDLDPDLVAEAHGVLVAAAVQADDGLTALDAPTYTALSEHPTARVECVQMVIQEDGVCWMAYPKHVDEEIRTARVPWAAMGMEAIRVDE